MENISGRKFGEIFFFAFFQNKFRQNKNGPKFHFLTPIVLSSPMTLPTLDKYHPFYP
jgi:hypothetical protein